MAKNLLSLYHSLFVARKVNHILVLCSLVLLLFSFKQGYSQGTWTPVTNLAPAPQGGGMLLLTDGTVICKTYSTGGWPAPDSGWIMLTPDIHGSYVNGTWSVLPSMHWGRFAFSSQVMPDGNVYVAGSEHGNGTNNAEIYNTVTKTWTPIPNVPGYDIEDANSELLYDGTVLEGCANPYNPPIDTINMFYSPVTGVFSVAPSSFGTHEETSWVKLPDSSVLYVDALTTTSERYIPKLHKWIHDGTVPVNLYDPSSYETGAGLLLPNSKVFFIGDVAYTALYTPSGNTSPGTWTKGPIMPSKSGIGQLGSWDGPAANMVNGKILCTLSPTASESLPTFFYEFDYTTNTFTQVKTPEGADSSNQYSNFMNFLDLPDGTVLYGSTDSTRFYIYTPKGSPIPQGKPTIDGVFPDGCNKYMITGKLFNGISEGAAFGDDWQMSTNYPLVRLTSGSNVYYAKTSNWNRLGAVMTDSAEDTAYFTLPSLPGGNYSLVVIANGFASSPIPFTTFGVAITSHTDITSCHGVGGATAFASYGSAPYTYSWTPGGGTNASDTNLTAGTYTVTVTENGGCTASASVTITQPSTMTLSTLATGVSCAGNNDGSAKVTSGGGWPPYTYSWNTGATTSSISGLIAGNYTVTVTDTCGFSSTAMVAITQPGPPVITLYSITNETCYGDTAGFIYTTVSGGRGPYTYSWSPKGGDTANAYWLSAGTYTLTVTDSCKNVSTLSETITQPAGMSIIADSVNESVTTPCNGKAKVTVSGGVPPYTYSWSPGGQTADSIYSQCSGVYCCTITDNSGCSQSRCITINNITGVENTALENEPVTLYPNPTTGNFIIEVNRGKSNTNSIIEIYNILGEKVFADVLPVNQRQLPVKVDEPTGLYMYRVVTDTGTLIGSGKFVISR